MNKEGSIILKRKITSKKFNVVFPSNIELRCFMDRAARIFAQHPKYNTVYIRVGEKNIKNPVKWD